MKPQEFWNCTYREANLYVQSFFELKEDNLKIEIQLLDALSDKLLMSDPQIVKKPVFKKLIKVFGKLFEKDVENTETQSLEEIVRNLRGMK